jgi:hypothetical protein
MEHRHDQAAPTRKDIKIMRAGPTEEQIRRAYERAGPDAFKSLVQRTAAGLVPLSILHWLTHTVGIQPFNLLERPQQAKPQD